MIKIRTYNINTDERGEANLSNSHVKFLSSGSSVAWADLTHILSEGFLTAQLTSNFTSKPFKLSLVFTYWDLDRKFKPEDSDKVIDYIDYLINCMEEPSNGIIITLYNAHIEHINGAANRSVDSYGVTHDINFPWAGNAMWPFKKEFTYKGHNSNYVAVNLTEPMTSTYKLTYNRYIEKILFDKLEDLNLNYKYFSYSNPIKETIETIINSKIVLCYDGGGTSLSAITKTPYIGWGEYYSSSPHSGGGVGRASSAGVVPSEILTYDFTERRFQKEKFGSIYGVGKYRIEDDSNYVYELLKEKMKEES